MTVLIIYVAALLQCSAIISGNDQNHRDPCKGTDCQMKEKRDTQVSPRVRRQACADNGQHCSSWSSSGFCTDARYSEYMKGNCPWSCNQCENRKGGGKRGRGGGGGTSGERRSCTSGQTTRDRCLRKCSCVRGERKCSRVRKDFTSMSREERKLFVRTLISASKTNRFKELVTTHSRLFQTTIHQMQHFLPWHRWFLLQMEDVLLDIDCKVTIPYWDWSLFSHDPWRSNEDDFWSNDEHGFGGNGKGTTGCIDSGPFKDWKTSSGGCLTRRFTGNPPDVIALKKALRFKEFPYFENDLRINLHNVVHCLIGGNMCSLSSASSPEFWLHHGFIDKVWYDWQQNATTQQDRDNKDRYFAGMIGPMPGTHLPPRNFIDSLNMEDRQGTRGVVYEDPTHDDAKNVKSELDVMSDVEMDDVGRSPFSAPDENVFKHFNVSKEERVRSLEVQKIVEPIKLAREQELHSKQDHNLGFHITAHPHPMLQSSRREM